MSWPETEIDLAYVREAESYGIDRDDPLIWSKVNAARRRAKPCRDCGREGPRKTELVCDDCVEQRLAEQRAKTERAAEQRVARERVGEYQADGHGCVEKVSPVERAYLNGEWF